MNKYYLTIMEVSRNGEFAIFQRNDDEYGWLEPLNCEVSVGDILEEIKPNSFIKCGPIECLINKKTGRIHINDYGFEEDIRKQYNRYAK